MHDKIEVLLQRACAGVQTLLVEVKLHIGIHGNQIGR